MLRKAATRAWAIVWVAGRRPSESAPTGVEREAGTKTLLSPTRGRRRRRIAQLDGGLPGPGGPCAIPPVSSDRPRPRCRRARGGVEAGGVGRGEVELAEPPVGSAGAGGEHLDRPVEVTRRPRGGGRGDRERRGQRAGQARLARAAPSGSTSGSRSAHHTVCSTMKLRVSWSTRSAVLAVSAGRVQQRPPRGAAPGSSRTVSRTRSAQSGGSPVAEGGLEQLVGGRLRRAAHRRPPGR